MIEFHTLNVFDLSRSTLNFKISHLAPSTNSIILSFLFFVLNQYFSQLNCGSYLMLHHKEFTGKAIKLFTLALKILVQSWSLPLAGRWMPWNSWWSIIQWKRRSLQRWVWLTSDFCLWKAEWGNNEQDLFKVSALKYYC